MSAAEGEKKSLLNNPVVAGALVVIAIVALVIQWRNITGGFPRSPKRPAVQEEANKPEETVVAEMPAEEPPAEPEITGTEPPKSEAVASVTPTYMLQELTPPLRDPFAEEVIKIEPLMGRAFEEPEVVPPPAAAPPREASVTQPGPEVVETRKPVLPDYEVVMVVAVGETLGAVIRETDREEILVFPGDDIGEETVEYVAMDGVILSGDYGTRALRLSGFQFGGTAAGSGRREGSSRSTTQSRSGG